jgi:hypothetical protein
MRKIRTVVYLEKKQQQALDKLSNKHGAPVSELVRRAIAEYIAKRTGQL